VLRSKYGVAVDWPLRYIDVEPWYVEAETRSASRVRRRGLGARHDQRRIRCRWWRQRIRPDRRACVRADRLTMAPFPQARNTWPRRPTAMLR
jgi:choline dehydrogenase-like flavoprotein